MKPIQCQPFLLAVIGLSLQRAEQGCRAGPEPSHDLAFSCPCDEVGFGRRTFTNSVPSTRNTHWRGKSSMLS